MGFPTLSVKADLATTWRTVLEAQGLTVRQDVEKQRLAEPGSDLPRVLEDCWLIGDGSIDLPILEATYRDRPYKQLIFMLTEASDDQQLLLRRVQDTLVGAGAAMGSTPKPDK